MTHCSNSKRAPSKRAFTLVELLVVVAIIVVVGGGISVTYGRKMLDDSKDQLTLHEMHEIKKAFLQFYNDNFLRLQREMNDHTGANDLPSVAFNNTFGVDHVAADVFDGKMDIFETYGLWFLMQRKIPDVDINPSPVNDYDHFPEFEEFDALTGEGWNGPYLDVTSREAWTYDGIKFPQVADKHGGAMDLSGNPLGVYRLLYYEHCEDFSDLTEPVYRRLLLVAPRGNIGWDEHDELLSQTGSMRGGGTGPGAHGRLNLSTGAFENGGGFFILELLNMDQLR